MLLKRFSYSQKVFFPSSWNRNSDNVSASRFQSLVANGPDDILIMHDMKYWSMR